MAAGKAHTALGQTDKAVALLQKAAELDPSNEVARYRLARAYQSLGNQKRAAEEFQEYRRLKESLNSLRSLYRQVLENRVTAQTVE